MTTMSEPDAVERPQRASCSGAECRTLHWTRSPAEWLCRSWMSAIGHRFGVKRVHEDVVILAELGLLERTEGGGLICPYSSMHIDMYMKAA